MNTNSKILPVLLFGVVYFKVCDYILNFFSLFQAQWHPLSVNELSCDEQDDHKIACGSICTSSTESHF